MIIIKNFYLLFITILFLSYNIKKPNLKAISLLILSIIILKGVNYNAFIYTLILMFYIFDKQKYKYVKIKINNKIIRLKGFIDSGNNIMYKNNYIVILNKKYLEGEIKNPYYVYYKTINSIGIMPCIKPDYIYINFIKYHNVLVGIMDSDNFDLILNPKIWEE